MKTKSVEIYTDGACLGNPGPGGWAAILCYNGHEREIHGGDYDTTNNRMELTAAIEGLKALKRPMTVELYTDSVYLRDGVTKWMPNWKKNGWRTAARKAVKNQDLWQELDAALVQHEIIWHWVKGHDGHDMNERADRLASQAAKARSVI